MKRTVEPISIATIALALICVCCAQAADLLPEQEAALMRVARDEPLGEWKPLTDEQAKDLYDKAEKQLDVVQKYLTPQGLVVDVWWTDYDRSKEYRYETAGDSATWTGHYLAALVMRYEVTGDKATLAAIHEILDKYDMLTRITGREGYIARYAGLADNDAYKAYYSVYGRGEDAERPGLGHWAYKGVAPWEDYIWLGNSSRDVYYGVIFGLATAWSHLDDPAAKQKVQTLVERIVDRLIEDDWVIDDGLEHTTRSTGWFRVAWRGFAVAVNPDKYPKIMEEYPGLARQAIKRGDRPQPLTFHEYFANNLGFIRTYATCVFEADPELKKGYQKVMRDRFEETKDHLNAHFAAMYLSATGDDNETAKALVQGLLVDLAGPPRWLHKVDMREDPDVELSENDRYVKYALLPRDRVPDAFMWQMSATLSHGKDDASYELPGLDLILPYWMGRAAGIIPAPGDSEAEPAETPEG